MANWYVWSGAAGAGTGADWTNAYTTLLAAGAAKAAGDVFFVAHDHVETQASAKVIVFAGTEANPNRVYCVNRAGSVPPVSADLRTTAQILTTGAFSISIGGSLSEVYGLIIQAGDSTASATINLGSVSNKSQQYTNCSFRLNGSATTSRIVWNSSANANAVVANNCTVQFTHVSQFMNSAGRAIWRNTVSPILGAIFPTTLLSFSAPGSWFLEGIDLSQLVTGKTLINGATTSANCTAVFKDCKLGGANITAAPTAFGGCEITLIRSDNVDSNYRIQKNAYTGVVMTEAASFRIGGASDGTTPICWYITPSSGTINANSFAFECPPITIWNETVGTPITVTLEGLYEDPTPPANDIIWIDVEYLGTSGFPLGNRATTARATMLETPTTYSTSSAVWNTDGMTSFSMAVTITPEEKGPITIYVRAKSPPTSYYYVCPKPVIS